MPTPNPEDAWPPEAQRFLDELYAKFGSDQTDEQRCNILNAHLEGERAFSISPNWSQERAMLEYEILGNHGLIKLVLC